MPTETHELEQRILTTVDDNAIVPQDAMAETTVELYNRLNDYSSAMASCGTIALSSTVVKIRCSSSLKNWINAMDEYED